MAGTAPSASPSWATEFRSEIPKVQKQLYAEVVKAGFFPENPNAVRNRHVIIGMVILFGALFLMIFGIAILIDWVDTIWAPFVALMLVGAAEIGMATKMARRTEAGALAAARWKAFARYLSDHQPREEVQSQHGDFEPYLPYAVAFGVDRQWVRKFTEVNHPAPHWYEREGPVIIAPGPMWGGGLGGWGAPHHRTNRGPFPWIPPAGAGSHPVEGPICRVQVTRERRASRE